MKWMLVDGNNWFARDWYATSNKEVAKQFFDRLTTIKKQHNFERVVVAWDSPRSFRKELCPSYKGNRESKGDDYITALAKVRSQLNSLTDCVECDGFEADDILATLTAIAHQEGVRVVLFSNDKDLHQLLQKGLVSQVTAFERASASSYSLKSITSDQFEVLYGVKPQQWVDYRVIVGDKSDGIAGVKNLGAGVALKVMSKCVSLEQFASSPFSVPGLTDRQRTLLLSSRKAWPELRTLLTLRTDVPLPATWFAALHGAT